MRCWGLLAAVIPQDEDWVPKLGGSECPERGGPFLAQEGRSLSPPSTKREEPGLAEAASWGGFPHCTPGGQAGCHDEESMGSPCPSCSNLCPPSNIPKAFQSQGSPVYQSLWVNPLNAERDRRAGGVCLPLPVPTTPHCCQLPHRLSSTLQGVPIRNAPNC